MWEQNRKAKISQLKDQTKDSDLEGCTFKPTLISNKNDYIRGSKKIDGRININSIDKYLTRMYSVRMDRENRKREAENKIGSGKHWKKAITIPQPPKLSQKRSKRTKKPFKTPLVSHHSSFPNTDLAETVQHSEDSTNFLVRDHMDKREAGGLIDVDPNMDYLDAVGMIHSHILNLDI